MYALKLSDKATSIFRKMAKREMRQLEIINRKILEIREYPQRFKPLSNMMKGFRSVHFGSFVMTYTIDETTKTVNIEDYDHHDRIYRRCARFI